MSPAPLNTLNNRNKGNEAQAASGEWAAKLRAVGSVLDGQGSEFRELCVIEVDDGFVVQARVRAKKTSAWTSVSLEIGAGDIASGRPPKPAR